MKVVFVATGDIALPTWHWLKNSRHEVVALVTQPDKPAGRKMQLTPPAIKRAALDAGVLVLQPESLRKRWAIDQVAALAPDLVVVMAYGQILTERFLQIAPVGCINLHASLLPKYRGASCIQAAIDAGDAETGITVMHMVKQLDAGDVICQKKLLLDGRETGGSLHDALAELAPQALAQAIDLLASGDAPRLLQDEALSSYVGKLLREDGRIDWCLPAAGLERRIRAYDPWPGTYSHHHQGGRLKIFPPVQVVDTADLAPGQVRVLDQQLLVGCGEGALVLSQLQAEGGKRMAAIDYARGQREAWYFVVEPTP
jgi:methionyl-tRNA formyltransferase